MRVGDLIKFYDISPDKIDDIGMVTKIKGRDVIIYWAKTGIGRSTIDRVLCEKKHFEVIDASG